MGVVHGQRRSFSVLLLLHFCTLLSSVLHYSSVEPSQANLYCPWWTVHGTREAGAVAQLARLASWFCLLGELPLHHLFTVCSWSLHRLSGRFFLGKNLYGNIWSGCCWAFPDPLLPGFRVQAIVGIGTGFWKLHLGICWSYIFFKQLGESLVCFWAFLCVSNHSLGSSGDNLLRLEPGLLLVGPFSSPHYLMAVKQLR